MNIVVLVIAPLVQVRHCESDMIIWGLEIEVECCGLPNEQEIRFLFKNVVFVWTNVGTEARLAACLLCGGLLIICLGDFRGVQNW